MQITIMIETIHKHLDKKPTDWQARQELADLLEEAGHNDEARLQRWLVEYKRSPMIWETRMPDTLPWHWWSGFHAPDFSTVGKRITDVMPRYSLGHATRQLAEQCLLQVLQQLSWPIPETEILA